VSGLASLRARSRRNWLTASASCLAPSTTANGGMAVSPARTAPVLGRSTAPSTSARRISTSPHHYRPGSAGAGMPDGSVEGAQPGLRRFGRGVTTRTPTTAIPVPRRPAALATAGWRSDICREASWSHTSSAGSTAISVSSMTTRVTSAVSVSTTTATGTR
jgi:hypothetical protein